MLVVIIEYILLKFRVPDLTQIVLSITENLDMFNVEHTKVEITIFSEKGYLARSQW